MTRSWLPVLVALIASGSAAAAPAAVEVRYLANEGVVVAHGGTEVMIDGLQRGKADLPYDVLRREDQERLETAHAPWSGVDLLLVSHRHLDHFHPEAVARFLVSQPRAELISSPQVIAEVRAVSAAPGRRMRAVPWKVGRSSAVNAAGARVTFLGLSHGSGRHAAIENYGHLVELGGRSVLHLGDASALPADFARFGLTRRRIDLALVPWWFLATPEGREVIDRHIAARRVAFVHAARSELAEVRRLIARHAPGAVVFARPLVDRIAIQ